MADADPNAAKTRKQLANVHERCDVILRSDTHGFGKKFDPVMPFVLSVIMWLLAAMYVAYAFHLGGVARRLVWRAAATGIVVVDKAEMAFSALAVGAASVFFATGHFF